MDFAAILQEVLRLQPEWTHQNTVAMARRGELIRHAAPTWLRNHEKELANAIRADARDVLIEGRDASGLKSEIPWFRFSNREYSPRARDSWYCVYLFRADGSAGYLSLMCGSTTWNGNSFIPRGISELEELAAWGRNVVEERVKGLGLAGRTSTKPLDLRCTKSKLGPAYERSSAVSLVYPANSMPTSEQLLSDALDFAVLLGDVYGYVRMGREPGALSPEAATATLSASEAAGRNSNSGQGFRVKAGERRLIEKSAMDVAREWLVAEGWAVTDKSASSPYDFECERSGEYMFVEVKGTTSPGRQIVLTRNEVAFHRDKYPFNALIVVSDIELLGEEGVSVKNANVHVVMPWQIRDESLQVISYTYAT